MSPAVARWADAARDIAAEHATKLQDHWSSSTAPHARRMLADAAVIAIRATAGEDVTTATIALDASMANLAREEKAFLVLEARTVALRAALFVLTSAIP